RCKPPEGQAAIACAGLACAVTGASLAPASGQGLDCNALRAQIAATQVGSADPRAAAAAQRQRGELDRTVAYADQLGCNRRQFLFFGSPPPPQCAQIEQRIATMRGNLARLQSAADRASGPRQALIERYNQFCVRQAAAPRNFFEQLFGGGGGAPSELPMDDFPPPEESGPARGSKAVCVRTCDGYFFPVSYNAFSQNPDRLADLCRAQCPNVETEVFTYSPSRDITEAVSINGAPYSSLTNALRYRRSFDPACTCRPPDKSWAETLAPAERLISGGRRDVIVTPEKAEELSRPRQQPPARGPATPVPPREPRAAVQGEAGQVAGTEPAPGSAEDLRRVRRVGPAL
ncbi:MAG: DUF2865 domain-containing protein, partial [Beijerinckiaceae bacterium]|nr:DUF2865 domain-containing protein [Beijerinckiaceae bacterium]